MKLPKIEKLPSGSYRAQVQINGERYSVTGKTEKEVQREVAALKLELKKASRKSDGLTLTSAIDHYIESRENVLSPSTLRGYKEIQRNRFKGIMGRKVSELTSAACQTAVDNEAKLCNAKTLKNAWGLVSSVIVAETCRRPCVRLPQVVRATRPFLDSEQIKVFIDAIKGSNAEIAALLALSSLRRSEIAALRWENVDMDHKVIHVEGAAVVDQDNHLIQKKTNKNATSRRTVPMIAPLYDAMKGAEKTGDYVVTLTLNHIYSVINKVCEENGLPKVGLHGLRHSFASLAYSLGMPEKVTMEIGGWADDGTMKRIYTHIAQQDKEKYQNEFTKFFEPRENAHENAHGI